MTPRRLPHTDLSVFPLCLGGNVFGWTADEAQSFAVLDAYVAEGGNFIDTADAYSSWVKGHTGGESEAIIGRWMAARGTRGQLVIATKVARCPGREGLSAANIRAAAEDSLRRLGIDSIDLYYAHYDDPKTPLDETMGAFDALVKEGKVRHVAASNYTAARLAEALAASDRNGFSRFVVLQPHYNLVERAAYEGPLQELCIREGLGCLPYYSLAKGFLTGKYRPGIEVESKRAKGALEYLNDRGLRVLAALDNIAIRRGAPLAAVALAWLMAQRTVVAPIASARTPDQVRALVVATELALRPDELAALTAASEPAAAN